MVRRWQLMIGEEAAAINAQEVTGVNRDLF